MGIRQDDKPSVLDAFWLRAINRPGTDLWIGKTILKETTDSERCPYGFMQYSTNVAVPKWRSAHFLFFDTATFIIGIFVGCYSLLSEKEYG